MKFSLSSPMWLLLIAAALLGAGEASISKTAQEVLQPPAKLQKQGSDRFEHSREVAFGFDLGHSGPLEFHERIDPPQWDVLSILALKTGYHDQKHDFEVLVKAQAARSELLECLVFDSDNSSLVVRKTKDCDWERNQVQIDVAIAVRPHIVQFGAGTVINTQTLPIHIIAPEFETYNMMLRSVYGRIESWGPDIYTAHEMNASTKYGDISGDWSLPSVLSLATDHGSIQADVFPKRWSSGPWTRGDLIVKTVSGHIFIRMPDKREQLSLRNATTIVTTESGEIRGDFVHGASTSIHSSTGLIDVFLQPYWAFDERHGVQHNFITTECTHCTTRLRVWPSIIDNYYKTRPMFFAKSSHKAKTGSIEVWYPEDWAGVAKWDVRDGLACVHGHDFEVTRNDSKHGEIQRRPSGSTMVVEVETGSIEIVMADENGDE